MNQDKQAGVGPLDAPVGRPVPEHAVCALDYYRAAVEQRAPKWVPARVRLDGPVRGDYPIGHTTLAEAGDHDCESNRWGAVSVRATNGQMLGVKPSEFEPIAWRENVPADPCPGCMRGGVCSTATCGRKRSSELMGLYGTP